MHLLTSSTSYAKPEALSELNFDCGSSNTSVPVGVIISVALQKFGIYFNKKKIKKAVISFFP